MVTCYKSIKLPRQIAYRSQHKFKPPIKKRERARERDKVQVEKIYINSCHCQVNVSTLERYREGTISILSIQIPPRNTYFLFLFLFFITVNTLPSTQIEPPLDQNSTKMSSKSYPELECPETTLNYPKTIINP